MKVLVIDYGMGNLGSLRRSLEECGADVLVSNHSGDLEQAVRIVLPGVGSFADGMGRLRAGGWAEALKKAVQREGIPFLGICLGMQLLADMGREGGNVRGLGFISGEVRRLTPDAPEERIPHVGWNEVRQARGDPLFAGVPDGTDFYFMHSYHFHPQDGGCVLARTPYCGGFVSAVAARTVYGVQFHPEKSSRAGRQVLRNFLGV